MAQQKTSEKTGRAAMPEAAMGLPRGIGAGGPLRTARRFRDRRYSRSATPATRFSNRSPILVAPARQRRARHLAHSALPRVRSRIDFAVEALNPLRALLIDFFPVLEHEFLLEILGALGQHVGDLAGHRHFDVGRDDQIRAF